MASIWENNSLYKNKNSNFTVEKLAQAVGSVMEQVQEQAQLKANETENTQVISQDELSKFWQKIGQKLNKKLGNAAYTSWFNRFTIERSDTNTLFCSVPTRFLRHWIETNYMENLLGEWKICIPQLKFVEIRVRKIGENSKALCDSQTHKENQFDNKNRSDKLNHQNNIRVLKNNNEERSLNKDANYLSSRLDKRMKFETFVVSPTNDFAFKAAWHVANKDIDKGPRYNPLYIHSSVGLGKTHLLHAIGWQAQMRMPASKIAYITAERFMYHFVSAIQGNRALKFKESFQNIGYFFIDDMQFLQGKNTKQEFCHIVNTLIDTGRQIVVAADVAPTALEALDKRMRSRLGGGLVVEIENTDYELRLAILERKLNEHADEKRKTMVPKSVLELIAKKLNGNGRDLEGALMRVLAAVSFTGRAATCEVVEHSLRDMLQSCNKRILIEDIMQAVCKHYCIDKESLYSKRRAKNIVRPRQLGMYLAKSLTSRSLPEIGRSFGGRDHTTVLHAVRRIKDLMKSDEQIKEDVNLLSNLIKYNHG